MRLAPRLVSVLIAHWTWFGQFRCRRQSWQRGSTIFTVNGQLMIKVNRCFGAVLIMAENRLGCNHFTVNRFYGWSTPPDTGRTGQRIRLHRRYVEVVVLILSPCIKRQELPNIMVAEWVIHRSAKFISIRCLLGRLRNWTSDRYQFELGTIALWSWRHDRQRSV